MENKGSVVRELSLLTTFFPVAVPSSQQKVALAYANGLRESESFSPQIHVGALDQNFLLLRLEVIHDVIRIAHADALSLKPVEYPIFNALFSLLISIEGDRLAVRFHILVREDGLQTDLHTQELFVPWILLRHFSRAFVISLCLYK